MHVCVYIHRLTSNYVTSHSHIVFLCPTVPPYILCLLACTHSLQIETLKAEVAQLKAEVAQLKSSRNTHPALALAGCDHKDSDCERSHTQPYCPAYLSLFPPLPPLPSCALCSPFLFSSPISCYFLSSSPIPSYPANCSFVVSQVGEEQDNGIQSDLLLNTPLRGQLHQLKHRTTRAHSMGIEPKLLVNRTASPNELNGLLPFREPVEDDHSLVHQQEANSSATSERPSSVTQNGAFPTTEHDETMQEPVQEQCNVQQRLVNGKQHTTSMYKLVTLSLYLVYSLVWWSRATVCNVTKERATYLCTNSQTVDSQCAVRPFQGLTPPYMSISISYANNTFQRSPNICTGGSSRQTQYSRCS